MLVGEVVFAIGEDDNDPLHGELVDGGRLGDSGVDGHAATAICVEAGAVVHGGEDGQVGAVVRGAEVVGVAVEVVAEVEVVGLVGVLAEAKVGSHGGLVAVCVARGAGERQSHGAGAV